VIKNEQSENQQYTETESCTTISPGNCVSLNAWHHHKATPLANCKMQTISWEVCLGTSCILWNQKALPLVYKMQPPSLTDKTLSTPLPFFTVHFNIIFPSMPRTQSGLFLSGFPTKTLQTFLFSATNNTSHVSSHHSSPCNWSLSFMAKLHHILRVSSLKHQQKAMLMH